MRFRPDDAEPSLDVELEPDGENWASEISFGRPPRKPGRHLGVAAVVVLAVVVGAAWIMGRTRDRTIAGPATTIASTAPSVTIATAPTAGATTEPGTTTTAYLAPAALGGDPGWDVYLSDANSGLLQVFDPVTGALAFVPGHAYAYRVVAGPTGPQFLSYGPGPYSIMSPIGDGTAWAGRDRSEVDRISLEDGAVLERLTVPAMAGPSFSGIGSVLGTAATGRPVVLLGDLRSYTIAADGSLQRFAEGAVVGPVDQGQFAETTCTTAGECAVVLQGEAASLALPELDGLQSTAFSPAGTHAAALQLGASDATGGSIRIFDLTVGEVFRQDFVQPPAYFLGASMGGWSADGRFFAFAIAGVLRLFDARTDEVSVLADHLASELGVVGVE